MMNLQDPSLRVNRGLLTGELAHQHEDKFCYQKKLIVCRNHMSNIMQLKFHPSPNSLFSRPEQHVQSVWWFINDDTVLLSHELDKQHPDVAVERCQVWQRLACLPVRQGPRVEQRAST